MLLILFRHGIAEERRPGLDDADRRLTTLGIERTRLAARGLFSLFGGIDRILTSPKLRALETAELLGQAVGLPIEICEPLSEGRLDEVVGVIEKLNDQTPVLVGHEPMLSMLAEQICGGDHAYTIGLKKAGAIVIRIDNLHQTYGVLEALLTPKALRTIGAQNEGPG